MSSKADYPLYHRRSRRLKGYDYSRAGAYFITVCTRDRECFLGDIADGKTRLNDAGRMVAEEWIKSADIRNEIDLDAFVVMPNHVHGIIVIANDRRGVWPYVIDRTGDRPVARTTGLVPSGPKPKSVGSFVGGFKSACTIRINDMRNARGAPVWQRNYYEHVIRDEDDLNRIREYILDNPARWAEDENNPDFIPAKADV